MNHPLHDGSQHAGQTLRWLPPDTQERYEDNLRDAKTRSMLESFGWIDSDITYSFNSHGFREQEFAIGDCWMALGCSFTQGTGVHQHQRWTSMVADRIGLRCWNLGLAGASLDTCYRVARYYLQVLQPRFVVLLEPRPNRMEIFDQREQPFQINWAYDAPYWGTGHLGRVWVADDRNMQIRAEKTRAAIRWLAHQQNIPVIVYEPDAYLTRVTDHRCHDLGRDLLHPGVLNNQAFADTVVQDIQTQCL
jgi:hypothetical protein